MASIDEVGLGRAPAAGERLAALDLELMAVARAMAWRRGDGEH